MGRLTTGQRAYADYENAPLPSAQRHPVGHEIRVYDDGERLSAVGHVIETTPWRAAFEIVWARIDHNVPCIFRGGIGGCCDNPAQCPYR